MISAVHLSSLFFCSAILGVMAFHPHVLWSLDFNMAATDPKIASLLKVGKRRKDSTSRICHFPRSSMADIHLHLIGQKWVMWLLQSARKLAKEDLAFKPLGREVTWRIVLGRAVGLVNCSVCRKSKVENKYIKVWSCKNLYTFEEQQIALEPMGRLEGETVATTQGVLWAKESGHEEQQRVSSTEGK